MFILQTVFGTLRQLCFVYERFLQLEIDFWDPERLRICDSNSLDERKTYAAYPGWFMQDEVCRCGDKHARNSDTGPASEMFSYILGLFSPFSILTLYALKYLETRNKYL